MNTDSILVMVFPLPELTIVPELSQSSVCIGHDAITDLQYTFSPVDGSVTYSYEYIDGPGALNLFTISDDPILAPFGPGGIDNFIKATEFVPQGTHTILVTATQIFEYDDGENGTIEKACTNTRQIQFYISDLIIEEKPEVFICEGETFDINTVLADSIQGLGKLYYYDDKEDELILITTGPIVSQEGEYYYDVHNKDGGCPTRCIIPLWFYDIEGGDVQAPNGDKLIRGCVDDDIQIDLSGDIEDKRWIVCDENGLILSIYNSNGAGQSFFYPADVLGVGTFFISHLSFIDIPGGLFVGGNINNLTGLFRYVQ